MKRELRKHTMHLFSDQWERLQDLHPGVAPVKIIRMIIDAYLKAEEPRMAAERKMDLGDVNL